MTKNNKAHGETKILRKILKTLERSPYEIANLYKYNGDKKIFVGSYRFDEDAWDNKGLSIVERFNTN